MFTAEQFNSDGAPDKYSSSLNYGSVVGESIAEQTQLYGVQDREESGKINSVFSELGYYQDMTAEEELPFSACQQEQQLQWCSHAESLSHLYSNSVSPPLQSCANNIRSENLDVIEPKKVNPIVSTSSFFNILTDYGSILRQLDVEKTSGPSSDIANTKVSGRKLSTDRIIRLAAEKFIESCSNTVDKLKVHSHPCVGSCMDLTYEGAKDVELVQCLLASAGKVGLQQYDGAGNLLNQCDDSSSNIGNPVQRLVYYFSEALREKIDRETGRVTSKGLGKKQSLDLDEALMSPNPTVISYYMKVPFTQISQFAGVQTVIDNIGDAKKVHVIDLEIRGGLKCAVLMQALAALCECPLEHLKITAFGTKSKQKIEETGERLMSFSQSMNLQFSFKVVMVADMIDLHEGLFELDPEEAVVVYSPYLLKRMITRPELLEHLMRVIGAIGPRVMVVTEFEANNNSPVFVNRFTEAIFFYGAIFDSLEDCMCDDDENRMIAEAVYFSQAIRNIVAAEGEERTTRHVNINVWRTFFARFGMVEADLSMSTLYQAELMLKNFTCGSSCTLNLDGQSLIIGWKGTPIHSLSAWKFL